MNTDELKKKCEERAKIFQQAMECCKSSNPIDCIEWFADRIIELEQENAELKETLKICEENADTYFDKLTKLQEQLVKTTQIGMTCSNCLWSQYDEDEMCYCCSNKDKWELKIRR